MLSFILLSNGQSVFFGCTHSLLAITGLKVIQYWEILFCSHKSRCFLHFTNRPSHVLPMIITFPHVSYVPFDFCLSFVIKSLNLPRSRYPSLCFHNNLRQSQVTISFILFWHFETCRTFKKLSLLWALKEKITLCNLLYTLEIF